MMHNETPTSPAGWERLPPQHLPHPTYFPAALAMGTTFIFWGLISSWIIFLVGIGLFSFALAGWVNEIRNERQQD